MKIEELREIINTNPMRMVETAVTHFDALLEVAEAAQKASLYIKDLSSYDDDWMHWLSEALKKLEAVK